MSRLPLQPLTELDAVNIMLGVIGSQPVNTLELAGVSEVSIAHETLHQVSRQVQSIGFRFNTEENYTLQVDVDGYIYVPRNALKVDPSDPNDRDIVYRGNRLYNRRTHSYKFDKEVLVDIVFFLPFEELPQAVRDYVTIRAARVFQARVLGDETTHGFTLQDEQMAYYALMESEMDVGDYNIFNNPDIQRILMR